MTEIPLKTSHRCQMVDISAAVARIVRESGVEHGLCHVHAMHTTAGITINENADPSVVSDILNALARIFPRDAGYAHMEGNSDAHLKSSLVGSSSTIPVANGALVLGTWQGIYFCEFDGPRSRRAAVTVVSG